MTEPPRSEDLGDETEICGCEEAVALRARVAELEARLAEGRQLVVESTEKLLRAAERIVELTARAEAADEHLEYHRREEPHDLENALRLLTLSESQCKALFQDRRELRAQVAALTIARDQARGCQTDALNQLATERAAHMMTVATAAAEIERLRAKLARVEVLIADSLEERHGPGGCGIYAYSLREALR